MLTFEYSNTIQSNPRTAFVQCYNCDRLAVGGSIRLMMEAVASVFGKLKGLDMQDESLLLSWVESVAASSQSGASRRKKLPVMHTADIKRWWGTRRMWESDYNRQHNTSKRLRAINKKERKAKHEVSWLASVILFDLALVRYEVDFTPSSRPLRWREMSVRWDARPAVTMDFRSGAIFMVAFQNGLCHFNDQIPKGVSGPTIHARTHAHK